MSDERRERVGICLPLTETAHGRTFYVTSAQIRPLVHRGAGVDGPGWQAQVRARHQDRQWRKASGLDPVVRARGASPHPGVIGDTARPSSAREPRGAARLWRWLLLFLAACALVSHLPQPWDLVLALGLFAVALLWAIGGAQRAMPPESSGRTR